jgi:2-polyprenyl-6-methoxyphenol hydroxylase-like FAD-dependent oxidoreductase
MISPFRRKALVIGGGISGMVTALFLKRAYVDPIICEARSAPSDYDGRFLSIAPNGINALRVIGLDSQLLKYGFPTIGMSLFSNHGKLLGEIKQRDDEERYGVHNVFIKQSLLYKALCEALLDEDIPLQFGKKLITIKPTRYHTVIATFADGTEEEADLLVGCDGIYSRVRQIILPQAPKPTYTGRMDYRAISFHPAISPTPTLHMRYGKQALFGYFGLPSGDLYWFSNFARAKMSRDELESMSDDGRLEELYNLHREDVPFISEIINATKSEIAPSAIYELPTLPTWTKREVCLVGDAAHAAAPYFGHGASTAMEDALVLAKCLRDILDVEPAFKMYENLRHERTEKIAIQARTMSQLKAPSNSLFGWLSEPSTPAFLKNGADAMDWIYAYQEDWNEEVVLPNKRRSKFDVETPSRPSFFRRRLDKSAARS